MTASDNNIQGRRCAVLLVNLGTPAAPTPAAVRQYLGEFLMDPRVVEIPRPVWWLILHGIILRVRPRKSAHAYASIWTPEGSPLLVYSRRLTDAVRRELSGRLGREVVVELAMRYGQPSIAGQLEALRAQGFERFLVLPLYPQCAASTTATAFDAVADTFKRWRAVPELRFVRDYHDHPGYIAAVADSIERHWREQGRSGFLLFSFHGLPERSRELGDPYYQHCQTTTRLIVERLGLQEGAWQLVFQSRFGPAQWLQPYCVEVLKELPSRGVKAVDVVCPGFAVDCLETLEEIAIANKEVFMAAGGESYRMIPALNDGPEHAKLLADIVVDAL
ncbi:ferrochelatase [Methylomagnum ishizawai]|uniref:ferrochelatase n=1 Tax=Methylomagnum ishizawai TaxID=1760988 RepID=UPI001C330D80|nr:ferrochelatase [Methylomagnum ishizawai]BBL76024.1 ferrochelatase 2 [Methylomagnum ishizawai]